MAILWCMRRSKPLIGPVSYLARHPLHWGPASSPTKALQHAAMEHSSNWVANGYRHRRCDKSWCVLNNTADATVSSLAFESYVMLNLPYSPHQDMKCNKWKKIQPPVWVPHIKQPARLDNILRVLLHLKELGRPYICDWRLLQVTVIDPCAQDYYRKVSEAANSIRVLVSWNQWNRQLSGFRSWNFAWRITKFTHHSIDAYRYWFPRIIQLRQHSYTTCFAVSRGLIECSRKLTRGFDIQWIRPSPFSRR